MEKMRRKDHASDNGGDGLLNDTELDNASGGWVKKMLQCPYCGISITVMRESGYERFKEHVEGCKKPVVN